MFLDSIDLYIRSAAFYFIRNTANSFSNAFLKPLMDLMFPDNVESVFIYWVVISLMFFNIVLKIFNRLKKVRL